MPLVQLLLRRDSETMAWWNLRGRCEFRPHCHDYFLVYIQWHFAYHFLLGLGQTIEGPIPNLERRRFFTSQFSENEVS